MSRVESVIVACVLLIGCPLAAVMPAVLIGFVSSRQGVISENTYSYGVLAVLAGVIMLTTIMLKRWTARFYYWNTYITLPVFLSLSVLALAVCMGTLIGNLMLGALAGLYLGRRALHTCFPVDVFKRAVRRWGLFIAGLMGLMASAMGLLAVQEQYTLMHILSWVRLDRLAETRALRLVIVGIMAPILMVLQYGLTRLMARWGYGTGLKEG